MAEQYIFTIENLSKAYGKREVLKNIWLAFYPGAKIGVIGSNGAGKSSLLRIMALQDKDFLGGVRPANGISIGFVPQEPRLDETKDVRGNLEEAIAPTRALLHRYEELSAKLGEPLEPDEMEKALEDLGQAQDAIDAANAWELDRQLEIAMDAMRLPPAARRSPASWNGRAWLPALASPKAKLASASTRSSPPRNTASARPSSLCKFRLARTSATSSFGRRECARVTATTCSWKTSTST